MSRTYRRTTGNQWWHNDIVERHTNPWHSGTHDWRGNLREREPNWEREMRKELNRYHSDAGWSMHTPSWWVLQEMTVPQRQEVRKLIHKVMHLPMEDAAELMFPLAKKPHEYYW